MNDTAQHALAHLLWPAAADPAAMQVHWLLDGARDPGIEALVRASGLEFACLFAGELHPRLRAAAPYLVRLPHGDPAGAQLLARGWGRAWGIFLHAAPATTFDALRLHLKKFLRVKTEDGKMLAFRYYDPRVLNVFLPTCTAEEFQHFLGPVDRLIAEHRDGADAYIYRQKDQLFHKEIYNINTPPP
jgi:hypothetical protein